MKKNEPDMPAEYSKDRLGKGVRGKHFQRFMEGTNLVRLTDRNAAAFPTSEAVNAALDGVLKTSREVAGVEHATRRRIRKPGATSTSK